MKAVLGLILSAALIAPAAAAWRAAPAEGGTAILRIEDGCGPGFHRGDMGRCRPNEGFRGEGRREEWRERRAREEWREQRAREERREERRERAGSACPRGYHFVPRDGRCWIN